jgi:hypothetical protein
LILGFLFYFYFLNLSYTNNMRGFNCDNFINVYGVPWTSSPVPLHS